MVEDRTHDDTIGEQRDQLARVAAMGADEDIDCEHGLHQLGGSPRTDALNARHSVALWPPREVYPRGDICALT
jgi:hypothetical protein